MDANEIYNSINGSEVSTNINAEIIRDMQIVYISDLVKIWFYVVFKNNSIIIFNNNDQTTYLTNNNTFEYMEVPKCDTLRVLPLLNEYTSSPLNYIYTKRDGVSEIANLLKYTYNNGNYTEINIGNSDNFNNFSYSNIMLYSKTTNNYFYYFICQDNFNNLYLS